MVPLVFKTSLEVVRPSEGSTPSLLRHYRLVERRGTEMHVPLRRRHGARSRDQPLVLLEIEGLARDLRNREFAREFLLAAMDEGIPIQTALGKVIRAMGVKEFASKVRMASPNVLRAINPRHNPTQETMNRLLMPFRLKLSLARIDGPGSRHAA